MGEKKYFWRTISNYYVFKFTEDVSSGYSIYSIVTLQNTNYAS